MSLRHDYKDQASRYDRSRGVSRDVVEAVLAGLEDAPGRRLLDVGGGTGNYAAALAARGWLPTVLDASREMLREAEAKGLTTLSGEASALPLPDASYDAVTMISMLHQVEDWRSALAQARRVLVPGGRLVIMGLAAEHLREVTWAYDLFASMRDYALPRRPSLDEMVDELPGAMVRPIWFSDLADGSIGALCAYPEAMLDPERRRQTSFFERLEREYPEELAAGVSALEDWLARGRRPELERAEARERLGDASVISWSAHR